MKSNAERQREHRARMRARTQGLKRARAIAAENGIVLYEGVLVAKYPDGYVAHLKWNGSKWEEFTP